MNFELKHHIRRSAMRVKTYRNKNGQGSGKRPYFHIRNFTALWSHWLESQAVNFKPVEIQFRAYLYVDDLYKTLEENKTDFPLECEISYLKYKTQHASEKYF